MPLTDKGFLLHGHLGTVMGNGYDNATMPRFTYGYGANGQAAYVRDSELNRTVWTEYDTSERPMRVHVLEGGDEDDFMLNAVTRLEDGRCFLFSADDDFMQSYVSKQRFMAVL